MNDLNAVADRGATLLAPGAAVRDQAACALVLGFAGLMWFGWSQEGPPSGWTPFLIAGSALAVIVAVPALLLTIRRRHVVEVHFLPLARLFRIPTLGVAGVLAAIVGIAAAIVGISSDVLPSAVAGGFGGLLLAVFGAVILYRGWRQSTQDNGSARI